jgi:drug/metabolite transporter (DMT)-like permease
MPRASRATLALVAATVAVSFSASFIRIAHDDAATIVWLRMSMAALLLMPVAARDPRLFSILRSRRDALLLPVSGILLAGHFLLWTASLAYTSVAASVLLVSLHPVIVAPLARRILHEQATARVLAGMTLALLGTAVTCAGDFRLDARALLGDLLAIGGAVCLAGYLIIGRGIRRSIGVSAYSAAVYASVALVAALTAAASGAAHMPTARVAAIGLALAVVCTIGGHTVYNWTLRRVHALTVSLAFLGEAPLAALLAFIVLRDVPPLTTIAGGVLILIGLALSLPRQQAATTERVLLALE